MKRFALVALVLVGCSDTTNVGFTSKRDVFSSPRWALTLGSSGVEGAGRAAFDPTGDLIVSGGFTGTVDFGDTILHATTNYASWISKRAGADGTERWTIAIGADQAPATIADLKVLPDGSMVVIGSYEGALQLGTTTLSGASPCYLAKLDDRGNILWARSIDASVAAQCSLVAVGPDGGIAVVGWYVGTIALPGGTFTARDHDTFLITFDAGGSPRWGVTTPNVGMTNGVVGLTGTGLVIAPNGEVIMAGGLTGQVILAGEVLKPSSRENRYAARFAADGRMLRANVLGPAGAIHDPTGLRLLDDGSAVLVSTRSAGAYIGGGSPTAIRFDESGQTIWERSAKSEGASAMVMTTLQDGTVVFGGSLSGWTIDPGEGALRGCLYLVAYDQTSELRDATTLVRTERCPQLIAGGLASGPSALALTGSVDASVDLGTGPLRHAGAFDAFIEVFDVP